MTIWQEYLYSSQYNAVFICIVYLFVKILCLFVPQSTSADVAAMQAAQHQQNWQAAQAAGLFAF